MADCTFQEVYAINCFRQLEDCDSRFESHSTHGLCLGFSVFVLSFVGSGLDTDWDPNNCNKHSHRLVLNVKKPEGLVHLRKYSPQQMFKSTYIVQASE
jgi:hypothetical protein